jgi:rubrerythrin
MKKLTFSNAEVKKIVDTVAKGKKWDYSVGSDDGKFTITLRNNPKASKIDVLADKKYVDDYSYDVEEKDDVYATVLNVLDYLTNLMNKYNKRHVVTEDVEPEAQEETKPEAKYFNIDLGAEEFQEGLTKGMLKAYSKRMKETDVHYTCKSCETNIPKYKGSYPNSCPSCGESIKLMKETDKDEAIWGGPFKRGEVVKVSLEDPKEFYDATLITYNVADNTYGAELKSGDVGKVIQGIKAKQIKA